MTTRKGDVSKKGQKYQNTTAFKPDRYGQCRRVKLAASLPLAGLCERCREKIEWKKKYDKYKALTVPKTCVVCGAKKVKQAYYRLCRDCSRTKQVCACCGQKEKIVENASEQAKEKSQLREGLKMMSERERRKFMREQLRLCDTSSKKISSDTTSVENDIGTTCNQSSESEELEEQNGMGDEQNGMGEEQNGMGDEENGDLKEDHCTLRAPVIAGCELKSSSKHFQETFDATTVNSDLSM